MEEINSKRNRRKNNIIRNSKGITLVALVITIIILLILAGLSISSLTGSGLFQKASDATKESDRANVKEQLQLVVMVSINNEGNIDKEELRKELDNLKKNETIDSYEEGKEDSQILYEIIKGKDLYRIKENGEVEIKGVAIIIRELTVKSGDRILEENSKEISVKEPLKVSFKAEIESGRITEVKVKGIGIANNNGVVEYITDGSTSIIFEIEGKTEEGMTVTKQYELNLKGYYNIPDIKVGDYVNYIPDIPTQEQLTNLNSEINTHSGHTGQTLSQTDGLKWRILELDETGTKPKTLISANSTNESLTLYGANGYNNAVYLLNEACKTLYSKAGVGTARSITIEDLEDHYSEEGENAKETYSEKGHIYGETKKYEGSFSHYPNIAKEEKNIGIDTTVVKEKGLDISEQGKNSGGSYKTYEGSGQASTNGITVTQNYYYFSSNLSGMYNSTNPYYNLFHSSIRNTYWLASRCVYTGSSSSWCDFNVRYATSSSVGASTVFYSDGSMYSTVYRIRPIVSIESNIKAEYDGKTSDNEYNTWNLKNI